MNLTYLIEDIVTIYKISKFFVINSLIEKNKLLRQSRGVLLDGKLPSDWLVKNCIGFWLAKHSRDGLDNPAWVKNRNSLQSL